MTSTISGPFGVLRVEREVIDVTSSVLRTDKAWTYTDKNGHEHYWRDGYPTLRWVIDETYWCEDCRDEHSDGHWECSQCGEHITPRMLPPSMYREFAPGPVSYYLNDAPIPVDEANRILAEIQAAGRSEDAAPNPGETA